VTYQYRGTMRDTEDLPRRKTSCGTYSGYKRHQSHRTTACKPCKAAAAKYMRELRARRKEGAQ
jgi:hypothetical protein